MHEVHLDSKYCNVNILSVSMFIKMSLIDTNEDLADPSMTNVANKNINKQVGLNRELAG